MKKTISLTTACFVLTGSISSSFANVSNTSKALEDTLKQTYKPEYQNNISIYGAGQSVKTLEGTDRTYKGFGIKYDSDYSEIVVEKGSDYKRASVVQRIDINKNWYTKAGVGYLEREETILAKTKDVKQITLGLALGYGDDKSYNIEIGHLRNKLSGAYNADTTTKIWYTEAVFMHHFEKYGSLDLTASYQNAKVYSKSLNDYSGSLAYYPIDDLKFALKYDSIEHDNDNYRATTGLNYKFAGLDDFSKGKLSPTLMFTKQAEEHLAYTIEYKEAIAIRSLKMRDKFEEQINTTQILAKQLAPEEFKKKSTAKPEAKTTSFTMKEDTIHPFQLIATDANGLDLTFAKVKASDSNIKKLVINPDGSGTLETIANFYGKVSFQYSVSNGVHKDIKTVEVTVTDVIDDTVFPIISLNGESSITLNNGDTYAELGASATDNLDGKLPVTITGKVDTSKNATYYIKYSATDSSGNTATAKRKVIVQDPTNAKATLTPPTLASSTTSSLNFNAGTCKDEDGVRNIKQKLYSDSGLNNLVSSQASAKFTGLSSSRAYYGLVSCEVKNGISGKWEEAQSKATKAYTDTPAPPPTPAPTWNQATFNTGLTITDGTDNVQNILNLASSSSNASSFSIVSISVPGESAAWDASISISGNTLIVSNLQTNDPEGNGAVTIRVRATNASGSSNADVNFTFNNVQ